MTITVNTNQTMYDLAVNWYGSIEGIAFLIADNPKLKVGAKLKPGQVFNVRKEYFTDTAVYLRKSGIVIANKEHLQQ